MWPHGLEQDGGGECAKCGGGGKTEHPCTTRDALDFRRHSLSALVAHVLDLLDAVLEVPKLRVLDEAVPAGRELVEMLEASASCFSTPGIARLALGRLWTLTLHSSWSEAVLPPLLQLRPRYSSSKPLPSPFGATSR